MLGTVDVVGVEPTVGGVGADVPGSTELGSEDEGGTTTTASGAGGASATSTTAAGALLRTGSVGVRSTIGAADAIDPTLVAARPATADRPTALVRLAPADAAVDARLASRELPAEADAAPAADAAAPAPAAAVDAPAPDVTAPALPDNEPSDPADDIAPLDALPEAPLPSDADPPDDPPDVCAKADCGNSVNWANSDSGPITRRNPPSDTDRNARTTAGSKWLPAQRASSIRASEAGRAFL